MDKLAIPSVPHLVHIETTYACNSDCVFCYNPRRGEKFSKEKIDPIVKSIFESWVPHVYLIGGEPSLLGTRQINQYTDLLAERSSVTIVTNGLICLRGLTQKMACVGVPIHGNEKTHERHTQRSGGYRRTIRSIEYYVSRGIDVRCIPVLTSWNYDQMYDVIRLAKELGMESVFVDRFEDGGLGSCRASDLKPSLEQFKDSLGQMIAARDDFNIPVGFGTAIPYCLDPRLMTERMSANCGVGVTFAAVNPEGDVRICNQSERVYGNVLRTPIEKIWADRSLDEFRDLQWVSEPCKSCPVLTHCVCGCKVDCSCSDRYCVDYAVRGLEKPPYEVSAAPQENVDVTYPAAYRNFRPDPYLRLNTFHPESYLVTRYQTITLDDAAEEIVRVIVDGETSERSLVERFSETVEEPEIRQFVSKLLMVGAIIA